MTCDEATALLVLKSRVLMAALHEWKDAGGSVEDVLAALLELFEAHSIIQKEL